MAAADECAEGWRNRSEWEARSWRPRQRPENGVNGGAAAARGELRVAMERAIGLRRYVMGFGGVCPPARPPENTKHENTQRMRVAVVDRSVLGDVGRRGCCADVDV